MKKDFPNSASLKKGVSKELRSLHTGHIPSANYRKLDMDGELNVFTGHKQTNKHLSVFIFT